jgi:hypothetical protein
MTGLDPVIHVFLRPVGRTWMAGASPAMTRNEQVSIGKFRLGFA